MISEKSKFVLAAWTLLTERLATMLIITPAIYFIGLLLFTSEVNPTDFDDLGKLMLGGFLAAIAVALLFTFIRMRLKSKRPRSAEFISISANQNREQRPGPRSREATENVKDF